MKYKLSKAQQEVVDKMREGWELVDSIGRGISFTQLQQGGHGSGGQIIKISRSILKNMVYGGVIEKTYPRVIQTANGKVNNGPFTYVLTEQYKTEQK